jgi:hypothetical protein
VIKIKKKTANQSPLKSFAARGHRAAFDEWRPMATAVGKRSEDAKDYSSPELRSNMPQNGTH